MSTARAIKLLLPFAIAFVFIGTLYVFLSIRKFATLATAMGVYLIPPAGKETIIPLAVGKGVAPVLVASSIAFVDIVVGLFLVWNFDLARRIPLLGKYIEKIERKGEGILSKRPWIKSLAWVGLMLFVMVPFQGSGAVSASIIGRLVGMRPWSIWYAIVAGSLAGCFAVAYSTALFIFLLYRNVWLGIVFLIIISIIACMIYLWRRRK